MKSKFILSLLLVLGSHLHAQSLPDGPILEIRASYYHSTSSEFRELFHDGTDYQLTGTLPVFCGGDQCWLNGINLWGAVDYYYKHERIPTTDEKYNIRLVPVTFGVKYFFPALALPSGPNFYAAAGMKYYFLRTHTDADLAKRTIDKNGMGGVVEAGLISSLCDGVVLDVFVSYSFKTFGAPSSSDPAIQGTGLNLNSVNVGGGIGYMF